MRCALACESFRRVLTCVGQFVCLHAHMSLFRSLALCDRRRLRVCVRVGVFVCAVASYRCVFSLAVRLTCLCVFSLSRKLRGPRVRCAPRGRCFALVAFTFDNGLQQDAKLYYALNKALRERRASVHPFKRWQGFLYFLMRALEKLPPFQGTVYRGGNAGLDQATVRREYTMGRPIQWAAFSSTAKDVAAARRFVKKDVGVVFKLNVVSGRDIVAHSYFPRENEILLSPNTRFTVASELYMDEEGFACMDLTETAGPLLQS
jgi:hypothetical protein